MQRAQSHRNVLSWRLPRRQLTAKRGREGDLQYLIWRKHLATARSSVSVLPFSVHGVTQQVLPADLPVRRGWHARHHTVVYKDRKLGYRLPMGAQHRVT